MNEAIRMQLSAFADGELPDNEKELLLRRLSQDPAMRRQVAEYLALGRAIRGEVPVRGIERLRARVAEAIGALDAPPAAASELASGEPVKKHRFGRPAAGFGIAAAVALLAIFGLGRFGDETVAPAGDPALAGGAAFPAQPAPDDRLNQYRLLHDAEAADSSMRSRFTNFEERQELVEATSSDATETDEDSAADDDQPDDVPAPAVD